MFFVYCCERGNKNKNTRLIARHVLPESNSIIFRLVTDSYCLLFLYHLGGSEP